MRPYSGNSPPPPHPNSRVGFNSERGVASCSSSAHSSNYHLYRSASRSSSYKGPAPYRVYATNHSHPLPNNHSYHLNHSNHTNHAQGHAHPRVVGEQGVAVSDDCINSSSFPPDYLVSMDRKKSKTFFSLFSSITCARTYPPLITCFNHVCLNFACVLRLSFPRCCVPTNLNTSWYSAGDETLSKH